MGKTLYLECNSGISGDMTVAALLDLGADQKVLEQVLATIPVKGFQIACSRVKKAGIDCMDFNVQLDAEHENHDHDMEYLHGHDHEHEHHHGHEENHDHNHDHSHEENHDHDHDHSHEENHDHSHDHEENHDHTHHHEHRGMKEIMAIVDACEMTDGARTLTKRIFQILAESEARAHAVSIEEVHFHEVGAVDSIVDIVSAAVCLDNLGITEVIVPKLCEGTGTIRCQHGILSVPVPAVANIMEAYQLPVSFTGVQGELVTPTGAAIVAAVKTGDTLPEAFTVQKLGMGAGKRNYERPSILRAMLIESHEKQSDIIYKLESNIDDCTGEMLGYVMEQLLAAGARDVHYMPVFMKKNRPAYQLNVICKEQDIRKLEEMIFRETTTIGIRRQKMERSILQRRQAHADTPYGEIEVKVCELPDGQSRCYPEYESVATAARTHHVPYRQVYQAAAAYIK